LVRFLLEATLKTRRFNSCYINELKLESLWKIIENYFLDMPLIHNKKIVVLKVYALAQKGLEQPRSLFQQAKRKPAGVQFARRGLWRRKPELCKAWCGA
jgi:hypothetical protein